MGAERAGLRAATKPAVVNRSYDNADRLTYIGDPSGGIGFTYGLDANGNRVTITVEAAALGESVSRWENDITITKGPGYHVKQPSTAVTGRQAMLAEWEILSQLRALRKLGTLAASWRYNSVTTELVLEGVRTSMEGASVGFTKT